MGVKRDLSMMNLEMRRHQRLFGEYVTWFEFDPAPDSSQHAIYSEGPSRMWFPPVVLPVFFGQYLQSGADNDDGQYTVADLYITFQVTEAMNRFRKDPRQPELHFDDRFVYDNHIYSPFSYEKQGFVHGTYLTISVHGAQVKPEEMVEDAQSASFFTALLTY